MNVHEGRDYVIGWVYKERGGFQAHHKQIENKLNPENLKKIFF
jgi:hypothetical protein